MNSYLNMIQSVTTKNDRIIKNASSSFCEYFNIPQFWYNKIDDRGSLASMSNHPAWTEYFAEQHLYKKCPLLRHSKHLQEGISIYTNNEVEQFLNNNIVQTFYEGEANYNKNAWFVIINKTKNGSDQFGFLADKSNVALIVNEMKLIKWFMRKFQSNIASVFSKLEDHRVNLIELIGPAFYKSSASTSSSLHTARLRILAQMGIEEGMNLNPREIEVVLLVLQGFSASAIAPKVFLAKRTIDHMLERIKEKLNCNSKTELIQKSREMEDLGYFNKI